METFYLKIQDDFIYSINENLRKLKFSHDDIIMRQKYLQKQSVRKLSKIDRKLENMVNSRRIDNHKVINDESFYKSSM